MKRLGLALGLIIVLLIAAAVILPSVIPPSTYREPVEAAARDALNREVTLGGELSLQILPQLQIRASEVSIANADGFGEEAFAEMREMRVGVRLIPLLSRRVEITEFVMVEPTIRLVQNRRGNNWTFTAPDAGTAAPAPASSGGFVRGDGALPIEASFGDVRIENGALYFSDAGQTRSITGLDLNVALPSLDVPTRLNGALNADGESLAFAAEIGSIRDFFEGRETPVTFGLGGNLATLSFDGRILAGEAVAYTGALDANIPSLRALAAFAGSPLPAGDHLERFRAVGTLSGAPGELALQARTLSLDAISGVADLTVNLTGARPRLTGGLELAELDVNPYLPAVSEAPRPASSGGIPPWSEAPIDLAGLGIVDADLRLTVGQLQFQAIEITDARLRARLNNSRLEVILENVGLYEGQGSATIVANNRGQRPSFSLAANLDGLDAGPFLEAAAGFDKLLGTGDLTLELAAAGNSQAAIMNSLDGSGNFSFADGAIVGINVAETIRNVSRLVSGGSGGETDSEDETAASTGERQTTDFSSLNGSFSIIDGQVAQRDLLMLSPLLRIEGAGSVNLPAQSLDYRLRPRAVASIEGQGGNRDLRGIAVPIRMRGGFNNVSVGVDTEAVGEALLQGALNNALGSDGATSPRDALRDGLLNAIGLSDDSDDEDTGEPADGEATETRPDPAEQLLRGLLNQRRNRNPDQDNPPTDDPQ
ncbi:AsmA family protein [Maricaulis sp.]|uniref:AsmA family protein n=1 Tax=Maricaulis sp. TaxID=1486257 RepID=UPI002B26F1AA|nr:AsmA family protein [Maricaulis sp.]